MKHVGHILGFTLIELLVTISIIGVLSSVVIVSLSSARTKSNEAAIIQSLTQFRNLYELAYSDNGNYASLQPASPGVGLPCTNFNGAVGYKCAANSAIKCSQIFDPTNGVIKNNSALLLCKQIVNMTGNFAIGLLNNANDKYSFWALLPSQNKYMCLGSSKSNSITQDNTAPDYGTANSGLAGCPANP